MKAYEFIDHTADIGVRVYGQDISAIFHHAAVAMFEVIATPLENVSKRKSKKIKIDLNASNQEELLICWLSELNYLSENKKVIFTDFGINQLTDKSLRAYAWGCSRKYFSIATEIKAVTYHELKIIKKDQYFMVQIIFDV